LVVGMTPMEPRAGNVHVLRGGVGAERLRKLGFREIEVRVSGGLVGGGGMTPIEPRAGNVHVFPRRRRDRGVRESWG
jgi:hypothetical protein